MIFVTGATGFVGGHVVRELRTQGQDLRCLVRNPERAGHLRAWGCDLVAGDVGNAGQVRSAMKGCDRVIHLVGIIQGTPEQFERVMVGGTGNVVSAAKDAGVTRFVLMSALGTSERSKDEVPYFHAKWEEEQLVKSSGLEYVIFRPSFIFGADGGALPTFLKQVRLSPLVTVIGPGRQRSQPIWVDDVARYFAAAVDAPEAANRTFELGGPDVVDWNELYARIAHALGKRRVQLHIPFGVMRAGATVAERLPKTPITRDQVRMLQGEDNVVSNNDAVETFKLPLTPLDEQLRRAA